ncbi:MAG: 3-deoxy-D-manno-octulosonic acid transferase [Candidatus Omnitrophica bacterium]|nr:3-deoxy-D-manno-octulosonic acid transferase [Candidatus Omnitrophota bacterium]MDD5042175.1 3-deoxy-D-manno-octulosonic acid transferase [Candidatus Omnitrophota bacterium]MDD5500204.1 3-deoxy-D-manno-octulosonic acid transferase [Candidatus Omnitrophota bacterium]
MSIFYDFISLVFVLALLPVYLIKGKFHKGFSRRIGFLPRGLDLDRPIWIHAVSVGEASSVKGLVAQLRKEYPRKKLVISTVTATGNKIARALAGEGDFLTYLPLDFGFIVSRVIKRIKPSLFIIAETEIWPNLIRHLHENNVPVVTVNGRISDKSYSGYRMIKPLIRPVLRLVDFFCVQSATDADRLCSLGVEKEKVRVTGNVKFDIELGHETDSSRIRRELYLVPEDKLWVCGSTHQGEEEIIIEAYAQALKSVPGLKLLIAPRHTERRQKVAAAVSAHSFTPVFISSLGGFCPACAGRAIFILDIMGELQSYYSAADAVFVGGSLVKTGGHNIIEPAARKKPVLFGPHMFNFRDISRIFLENKAGIMVHDAKSLAFEIKRILGEDLPARQMAERAYQLIVANKGATMRNIEVIKGLVKI